MAGILLCFGHLEISIFLASLGHLYYAGDRRRDQAMQDITNLLSSPANRERLLLATVGFLQGLATWIVVRIDPHEPLEKSLYFGVLAWILSSGLLFQFASSGTEHRRISGIVSGLGIPFALFTYHVIAQLSRMNLSTRATESALPPGVSPPRLHSTSSCPTFRSINAVAR